MKITVKQDKPKPPPKKYIIELDQSEAEDIYGLVNRFNIGKGEDGIDWKIYRLLVSAGVGSAD